MRFDECGNGGVAVIGGVDGIGQVPVEGMSSWYLGLHFGGKVGVRNRIISEKVNPVVVLRLINVCGIVNVRVGDTDIKKPK